MLTLAHLRLQLHCISYKVAACIIIVTLFKSTIVICQSSSKISSELQIHKGLTEQCADHRKHHQCATKAPRPHDKTISTRGKSRGQFNGALKQPCFFNRNWKSTQKRAKNTNNILQRSMRPLQADPRDGKPPTIILLASASRSNAGNDNHQHSSNQDPSAEATQVYRGAML